MPLPSSPNQISMSDIAVEKKGSGLPSGGYWQNISLYGLSVNSVTDFSYYNGDSLITADYTGTPNSSAPYGMDEFRGWSATSATTYDNTLSEEEYAPDSNIIIRPQLRVMYLNGNIDVNWYGQANASSPASGTLVYRITNPASGYTVRETNTQTGDGPYSWSYSSIPENGSAVSVPNSTFYQDWQPSFESAGSYDDEGTNSTVLSGNLIFEKSGETTFTYSFTLEVDLETAGEGGL
jgi:hypothetical protein